MQYKTLSIALLTMICGTTKAFASESEQTDTVIKIANARDITVTTGSGTISVDVGTTGNGNTYTYKATNTPADTIDSEWDLNLPFLEKRIDRISFAVYPRVALGWGWGFDRGYANGPFESKTFTNGTIELAELRWYPGMNTWFDLGFGINADVYRFETYLLNKNAEGRLSFTDCPDKNKSEIDVFSWVFPLRLNQTIYKDFSVTLGVMANLNTYAWGWSKYTRDEGEKIENRTHFKGLHQKILTVDYTASLNFDFFSIYARYSPNEIFKGGFGPSYKRMWVGVSVRIR